MKMNVKMIWKPLCWFIKDSDPERCREKFQKWMIKFLLGRQIKVKTWLLTFECLKFQNFKIENWKVNFNLAEFFAAYAVYG